MGDALSWRCWWSGGFRDPSFTVSSFTGFAYRRTLVASHRIVHEQLDGSGNERSSVLTEGSNEGFRLQIDIREVYPDDSSSNVPY